MLIRGKAVGLSPSAFWLAGPSAAFADQPFTFLGQPFTFRVLLRRSRHLVNTRKAPRKGFGSALGGVRRSALFGILGNVFRKRLFRKHLGSCVAAGVVLMTGTGVVAALSALSAEPERRQGAVAPSLELRLAGPSGVPFCHSSVGAVARAGATIRLAASRTEVPNAEIQATAPSVAFSNIDPPLWDGLGALSYKVTTANPAAQAYFDQGLRLAYAFNHAEAQRAFRKAE